MEYDKEKIQQMAQRMKRKKMHNSIEKQKELIREAAKMNI